MDGYIRNLPTCVRAKDSSPWLALLSSFWLAAFCLFVALSLTIAAVIPNKKEPNLALCTIPIVLTFCGSSYIIFYCVSSQSQYPQSMHAVVFNSTIFERWRWQVFALFPALWLAITGCIHRAAVSVRG